MDYDMTVEPIAAAAAAAARREHGERRVDHTVNMRRCGTSIYFSDSINYRTMTALIVMLREMETEMLEDMRVAEEAAKKSKSKYSTVSVEAVPITLYLTTHGGLVHAAFSAVDTIRALKVPVHTIITGYCASAGTLLSLAGVKKFMTPNSFMMIHEIRSGFWGKYSDARVDHENITKLMDHVIAYYVSRTKLTKDRLVEMLRHDTDLNGVEALEYGLVDTVA
jgi:ATP-dependent Clp endopeptidase proteolytic subunit ClpP